MGIGKWEGFRPAEFALSLAVLLAIFWFVDIGRLCGIIASASPLLFACALCAYFSTTLLMSYRLRMVIASLGRKITFGEAFLANWGGLLASDFTPGRSGYFVTPLLLSRNCSVPADMGMASVVAPQIAEFFLKAAGASLAIVLIAYGLPGLSGNVVFLWMGVAVMLCFCAVMWFALFRPSAVRFAMKFGFVPFVKEACGFVSSMQRHRSEVKAVFLQIALISAMIFLLKGLEWFLFGQALGMTFSNVALPPLLAFMLLQPLVTIFQFVPIPTAAGLGLSEGSAVVSMALLGVPTELAVAYVLMIRGGTILVNSGGVFQLVPFLFPKK